MTKSSWIMGVLGIVILVGLFWFLTESKTGTKTGSESNADTAQQQNQPVVINVVYDSAKSFTPQTYNVTEGSEVKIQVTSDIADELHFHGYDLHTDLESGKQGEIDFTANTTGRFEFELEDQKTTLGVIEVHPK
jgi:hypothetical protein